MPTRLLLEGPDIETLLARVRDEHGSNARIVSADKVRSGGLGGFFTKQRFEIAVEVNDVAGPVEAAATEPQPSSFEALLDRADARESRFERPVSPVAGAATAPAVVGSRREPSPTLPATERPEFTALLATLRARTAESTVEPVAPAATVPTPPPVAVPPAASPAAWVVRGAPAVAAAPDLPVAPVVTSPPAAPPAAASPPIPASAAPRPAAAPTAAAVPPAVPEEPIASEAHAEAAAYRSVRGSRIGAELVALGLPEHLAYLATGSDRYDAALRAVSALPPAPRPPTGPGEVLVVAGEPGPAQAVAASLAAFVGTDPARTLVAAPDGAGADVPATRRISGPTAAERKARALHAADMPQIVVVVAPVDGLSGQWAGAVTRALEPTAVWAVVDCTRKTADLGRHLRSLGWVDALAVHGVDASADPATVLGLGLPVAHMDGRRATPAAWAALLCDRLTRGRSTLETTAPAEPADA